MQAYKPRGAVRIYSIFKIQNVRSRRHDSEAENTTSAARPAGHPEGAAAQPFDTSLETGSGPRAYTGIRKLGDKKALITGGQSLRDRTRRSGPLRAGGVDVSIVHLPEEQTDADDTLRVIQHEGRQALSIASDVLVNNASKQTLQSDFARIDLAAVERLFRSNVIQMFGITKHALPYMPRGSSITNTTSITTFKGSLSLVDYTATKGAIVGFTRSLAQQLISEGIRVNAVAPSPVHTPLQPASRPPEQTEGFGEGTKFGRTGQPSEIAPTYVFLASAEAELYYGQIMHPYPEGDI
ncbi:hypothetical protein AcW1_009345 [Taiwanofungus camphoratus]|nr:hypothetical protein AcV7_003972 [Antrodia cinnamomea]KAI0947638.1 hypothetical protein AcW1_009345 [Antrodia cinnamomea]